VIGELLPVLGGVILGVVVRTRRPPGRRWPWNAAGSVIVGFLAALVNGELAESWAFLLVDIPAAAVGAMIVTVSADQAWAPARRRLAARRANSDRQLG
jgi:hypothetical protein